MFYYLPQIEFQSDDSHKVDVVMLYQNKPEIV